MPTTAPQCRLEANYAHQQELDMIPLMMQKDYSPKGWRKSAYGALCCCCAAVVMSLTCGNDDDRSGSDFGHPHVVKWWHRIANLHSNHIQTGSALHKCVFLHYTKCMSEPVSMATRDLY